MEKMYFNEDFIANIINKYKETKDSTYLGLLYEPLKSQITGMIAKQFSYNSVIQDNKDDVISYCFISIIQSIKNYKHERGKLFPYFNRVIKNTLIKLSKILRTDKEIYLYESFINEETEYDFLEFAEIENTFNKTESKIKIHNTNNKDYREQVENDLTYIYHRYKNAINSLTFYTTGKYNFYLLIHKVRCELEHGEEILNNKEEILKNVEIAKNFLNFILEWIELFVPKEKLKVFVPKSSNDLHVNKRLIKEINLLHKKYAHTLENANKTFIIELLINLMETGGE